jgi:LPS sulfotransferase NodH
MSIFDKLAKPGIHEQQLSAHFGGNAHYRGDAPVFDAPFVCLAFYNRCGSNLLAGYLRDTPCFSGFHEQLNFDTVKKTCTTQAISSFPDYIRYVSEPSVRAGRIYGFKASWDQLAMLHRFQIDKMFMSAHVIHMTREDVLGQAISLLIADQTKQWTSAQVAQASNRVHYCSTQLKSLIQAGLQSEQIIRILCETNALPRTPVTYETLIANPALTIAKVAAALGADLTAWTPGKPHIEKQATSENDRFRARFLSELRTTLR